MTLHPFFKNKVYTPKTLHSLGFEPTIFFSYGGRDATPLFTRHKFARKLFRPKCSFIESTHLQFFFFHLQPSPLLVQFMNGTASIAELE
jgi:hypothetical protein